MFMLGAKNIRKPLMPELWRARASSPIAMPICWNIEVLKEAAKPMGWRGRRGSGEIKINVGVCMYVIVYVCVIVCVCDCVCVSMYAYKYLCLRRR